MLRTHGANTNESQSGISPARARAGLYRRQRGDEAASAASSRLRRNDP